MQKSKVLISAVIAVKDEEEMIDDCLKSLSWVDEIVIIDTGSSDKTVEIAKKYGARIVRYLTGKNFSDWRNKELEEAKGEWVLYIDADERVTPELKKEIQSLIVNNPTCSMYAIPRSNVILAKEFRHGGFWPDYVKRLFLKSKLKKWTGELHEEPQYEGEMGHLTHPLKHIKHEDFQQMVEKTNKWSEIEAKLMYEAGHPPMTIPRFISAMVREFWQRMILKRGFMDGPEGIMFAMYQVYSRFVSYAKLWELQYKNKN